MLDYFKIKMIMDQFRLIIYDVFQKVMTVTGNDDD